MELRAGRALNAMDGPEDLRQPCQFDRLARRAAGMVGGEAAVVGRMPVLRGHDQFILRLEAIDQRHDPVAFRHRQRAAGTEVVLNVNDDKSRHGGDHFAIRWPKITCPWALRPTKQRRAAWSLP